MRPLQALLLYLWGVLCFAATLGVPGAQLAPVALVGAGASVVGLVHELLAV